MLHTTMAYFTGCNHSNCQRHSAVNQRLELELQYTDKKYDIDLNVNVTSPPTITIHDATEDLLEFLYLDDIPPEDVRFVGFSRNGCRRPWNVTDKRIALREIGVINHCILYFEPTSTAAPPKLSHLTIVGPDEVEKIDYEWYTAKTTLGMLLEYVIEQFSLQSLERERIHLFTIFQELELFSFSDKRLSQFDIHNGMSIHVQIIPPLPSTTVNKDMNVHVQCTGDDNKFNFDISNMETIGDLKIKIEKRVEGRQIIDFKLHSEAQDEIDSNDSDRTLKSFGVKPGQTIVVTFRLVTINAQPPVVNKQSEASTKSSSSSDTKRKHDKIIVICTFPSNNPESFHVPVTNTVGQLITRIENLTHSRRLVLSKMCSSTINIDFKNETHRCLADLGFTRDDVINVTVIDKSPTHSSIVSRRPPSSPKTDKLSKGRCLNQNPIGLDNLGNSCYMNSALQCLAHVPQLTKIFLDGLDHAHMDDGEHTDNDWNPYDREGDVTGAYAELLWNLWRCDENDDSYDSFKPQRIKERIGNKDSRFATEDQQDAQEFMTFFLDVIHEELKAKNQNQKNTIIKELFFGKMTSTITCTSCNKEEPTTHPISFLSIPLNRQERSFYINFISKEGKDDISIVDVPIGGRVGHVVDIFTDSRGRPSLFCYILAMIPDGDLDFETPLSEIPTDELIFMEQEEPSKNIRPKRLELPRKVLTLQDCLQEFFSREVLEDEWTCQQEKCKKKTSATKQLKLCTLPPVLIIQFKRFSHENGLHQKVETFVDYPINDLNLRQFLASLREEGVYDLIAVSNHMGSISGGHYTACARHSTLNKNEWYKFDDSCVTLIKPNDYKYEIVSRNAYLLFYIKKDMSTQVTEV